MPMSVHVSVPECCLMYHLVFRWCQNVWSALVQAKLLETAKMLNTTQWCAVLCSSQVEIW